MSNNNSEVMDTTPDFVVIGGGIISATLGVFLHYLFPNKTIEIFEQLQDVAQESSFSS